MSSATTSPVPLTLDDIKLRDPGRHDHGAGRRDRGRQDDVAYLVARLYDVQAGTCCIDGVDVRELTQQALSDAVGLVAQDIYLFHDTVRENLRFAAPGATDEQMEAAARTAHIHDLIASLPDGYDTMVGARGHRFSGGERQRLAIARMVLRNPPILVLDEATSALDNETERAVQDAMRRCRRADHDRHRPPAVDRPRRRSDRRPRPRAHHRARHPRELQEQAASTQPARRPALAT